MEMKQCFGLLNIKLKCNSHKINFKIEMKPFLATNKWAVSMVNLKQPQMRNSYKPY
jgi:hypothetical protein